MMNRLDVAKKAVLQAGSYLSESFHKRHEVSLKEDHTVLLGEDKRSEQILLESIAKAFPTDSFFTEETETDIASNMIWVIDPLCGSYSYLRGVETWSISLALVSGDSYALGLVYQPLLKNLFFAEKGNGAFLNYSPIHVSTTNTIENAFVSLEHGVFLSGKCDTQKLIHDIKRVRVGHGSGGELSYVGAGFLDAVIKTDQTLMHFAGGRAIVEEAGGKFIDFSGNPVPTYFDRKKKVDYIATNAVLADKLQEYIH